MCGIAQRLRGGREEKWREKAFDEAAAGFASGSVSHFNLRLAKTDFGCICREGIGGRVVDGNIQAADPMLSTITVLRCS